MNKLLLVPIACGFAFAVTAQNNTALEIEQEYKIQELSIQLENANQLLDRIEAKVSIGLNENCNIESVPMKPTGPFWSVPMEGGTGKLWRYYCGGQNALIFTVAPQNQTIGMFVCPGARGAFIQNDIQYRLNQYERPGSTRCGDIYVPTNFIVYNVNVDIDQAFIFKHSDSGARGTQTFVPAAGSEEGQATIANLSGLWYDDGMDGLGFNIIHMNNGIAVYYYGYTSGGQRLWLISATGPAVIIKGQSYTLDVYEGASGNGANFTTKPSVGSGIAKWGTLTMSMQGCAKGEIVLNGNDGSKAFAVTKLANINGVNCTD